MMVNSPCFNGDFHQAMDLLWSFLRRTPAEAGTSGTNGEAENQKHLLFKNVFFAGKRFNELAWNEIQYPTWVLYGFGIFRRLNGSFIGY